MEKLLTQEHADFLENLREDGYTNMFGAAPYLQEEFGLSKKDAQQVLTEWMRTYE